MPFSSSSHVRILYVDDDQDSSDLLSLMLYQSDNTYSVTTISTAKEALNIMQHLSFNLYILDYALPELSGVELCQKIREKDKQTPIMFFTAMARPEDYAAGIKAGANEYLVKPNDLEKLTETVKRLLNKGKLIYKRKTISRKRCSSII